MKEQKSSKSTVRTPIEKLKGKETVEHYNAVLLEDIKSKMELVLEKADSTEASLIARIEDVRQDLGQRLTAVEVVVRGHSQEIQGLKSEMQGVQSEMQGMKSEIQGVQSEMQGMKSEMKNMEHRLSDKIDKIADKVESQEIKLEEHLTNHPHGGA